MSLVARNMWMRGRSESLTACHAASMSCFEVRARPQMTGPSTSRAIACTDSKSPGEVIGNPASMMSTPRRASWWAISSFSCLFNEIPGDCSPSRRVVSKILTRFASLRTSSLLMSFVLLLYLACHFLSAGYAATRPPRAIPPEGGGEEAAEARTETTCFRQSSTAGAERKRVRDRHGARASGGDSGGEHGKPAPLLL